jgi:hypothetical protein
MVYEKNIIKSNLIKNSYTLIIVSIGTCFSMGGSIVEQTRPDTSAPGLSGNQIDRHALVGRHNVMLEMPDPLTPLSIGNGRFVFTSDITGLQTFEVYHRQGVPLCTQSEWGWHTSPNPEDYKMSDVLEDYKVAGRKVPYASDGNFPGGYSPAATWLRANPHRLHLGRIGFNLTESDGSPASIEDLTDISQKLDLWRGFLSSRFEIEGRPVKVKTVCHPERDLLAIHIESVLLPEGRLPVLLTFPYGKEDWRNAVDWDNPDRHTTLHQINDGFADLTRKLDSDRYYVRMACSTGGGIRAKSQHEFEIVQKNGQSLEVVFGFSPEEINEPLPDFQSVRYGD